MPYKDPQRRAQKCKAWREKNSAHCAAYAAAYVIKNVAAVSERKKAHEKTRTIRKRSAYQTARNNARAVLGACRSHIPEEMVAAKTMTLLIKRALKERADHGL